MPISFNLGSADNGATLDIQDATDSDVIAALAANTPFPSRDLTLGRITASFSTSTATFTPVAGSSVSMSASATFNSGVAIFSTADPVIQALPLDPSVSLDFAMGAKDRLILVSFGYTANGSINGTVPIGMLGSATFGVSGQSDAAFAIVHRFDAATGADTVMTDVADSFRLPTQVKAAADLQPGTWLIAEVDGTAALNIAASLGYKLDYTKQLTALGISHDLGVKIDASITATFGFTTSGKFLLAVSRAAADPAGQTLRIQLMKQRKEGFSVGLGLTAGITADPPLPATIDDLLAGIFGTQGQQILNDLHSIENWTTGDLGTNAAALITSTANQLLTDIGLDPNNLMQATGALKDALAKWDQLAQNGSAEVQSLVWGILGDPTTATRTAVVNTLTGLANGTTFAQTLSNALQDLTERQWLAGIAAAVGSVSGLALGSQQSAVQKYAGDVLAVLNGSIFDMLKNTITSEFDLSKILTATDPAALDQWVQARLAAFLDKTSLVQSDLSQIQTALKTLGSKITDLYNKTKSAINSRYSLNFAAQYSSNTADTALIDVEFDMSQTPAAALFLNVVGTGAGPRLGADALFADDGPVRGVSIREALLTHEIHTSATTHFAIPFLTADTSHLNDTVASLAIEQNGAHLIGSVNSKDQVTTGRFASILSLAESLTIVDGAVQPDPTGAIAYEMRLIRKTMTQAELVFGTRDFVSTYLGNIFPSLANYTDQFLKNFDITISNAVPNTINNFGDTAVSLQVTLSADILAGWLVARSGPDLLAAQASTSRLIQTLLRKFTALSYLQDLNNLSSPATVAPLLVWCALPAVAGVDFDETSLTITAVDTGKSTYWDNADINVVKNMVNLTTTEKNLEALLPPLRDRLLAAGKNSDAQFYGPDFASAASSMKSTVLFTGPQSGLVPTFMSLLTAEHNVVGDAKSGLFPASGAAKAIDAAAAVAASASSNARANIAGELATFANALTNTLNSSLTNLYTKQNLMLYGPMLLTEISRNLAAQTVTPRALLQLLSLKAGHQFDLSQFLAGAYPDQSEVAVAQTLVSGV